MGHDIDIREGGPCGSPLVETYISFNWSKFSNYFHINDIHGHPGKLAAKRLREALSQLEKDGFTPNDQMRVDAWGSDKNDQVKNVFSDDRKNTFEDPDYEKDLKCMFAHHLKNFLGFAERYPNGYWYSDQVFDGKPLYDCKPRLGSDDTDDADDADDTDDADDRYPVRTMVAFKTKNGEKHVCKIRTFGDAMEVHRLMIEDGDNDRAKYWYDFAFTLPSR